MHLPAAELLLKQFLKASDDIIARVPPQENFVALVGEPRFSRALASLRLLVQQHMPLLVRHLEAWRGAAHAAFSRQPEKTERDRMVTFSKRSALEGIYFEAALQLLDEYTDDFLGHKEFVDFYDNLQQSAFRLLMVASEDSFPPEVASLYKVVTGVAARVLGVISRKVALSHVVDPFMKSLSDRINPKKDAFGAKPNYDVLRAQIVRLASGMRYVSLSFDSGEAVAGAVDFLRRAHPLTHTAPIKKSQIHHALADMLNSILLPLVRSDAPQRAAQQLGLPALESWYGTVMSMRNDITNWMNKHQKHVNDGYPLSTTLVCLASDRDYSANVDVTADFLHKGLKVKENRAVCVRCLVVLACSYQVRYGAHIIKHELHKWLDRTLKPVIALAKKGGLTIQEQLDVIAPIAELSPEFAVHYLLLELLNSDNQDCVLAGLKALQGLILTAPAVLAGVPSGASGGFGRSPSSAGLGQGAQGGAFASASAYSSGSGGGANMPSSGSSSALQALLRRTTVASLGGVLYGGAAATAAGGTSSGGAGAGAAGGGVPASAFSGVNDMLRRGIHPLDVLGVGHLLPRLSAALAKLMLTWHPLYGSHVLYGVPDPNWKEKVAGLPLLLTLVRLLPYLKPETWPSGANNARPFEWLPIYSCHVETAMRTVAVEALTSLLRGCPHLRNAVVCSVAAFTASLPDDAVQSLRDSQSLLRGLMELWVGLLAERAAGDALELSSSGLDALSLDVHRLEGYGLVCLASHDEGARREALQTLALIRTLHQAVLAAEPYDPPASPVPFIKASPATPAAAAGGAPAAGAAGTPAVARNLSNGGLTGFGSGPSGAPSVGARGPVGSVHSHARSASRDSVDIVPPGAGAQDGSVAGGAGGGASGGSVLRSHPTLHGLVDCVDPDLTYLIELVEEAGPSLVRAAYWDFGEWSDIWRQYREVPDVAFTDVLVAPARPNDELPRVRLARALVELMGLAVRMCPLSAGVAGLELVPRLARMMGRSADNNRLVVLPEYLDTGKRDAWRNCSAMLCACPQSLRDRVMEKLGRRSPPITIRDVIRVHLALVTSSAASSGSSAAQVPASIQLCSMFSLGHLSADMYVWLMDELQPLMEEYAAGRAAGGGSKSKSKRPDELRRAVSHVFRILAERVPSEVLGSHSILRTRMLEFIRESYAFLRPNSLFAEAFWEVPQVVYCFASVVRNCAVPLRSLLSQSPPGGGQGPGGAAIPLGRDSQGRVEPAGGAAGGGGALGSPSLRKLLWDMIQIWGEEAYILLNVVKAQVAALPPGADAVDAIRQCRDSNYLRALNMGISSVLAKHKEATEALREDLVQASHYINHAARLALAALLEGPAFDSDARRPAGPVFTWIDKLLAVREEPKQRLVAGPRRQDVGYRALRAVLTHNPDLFEGCLDKCYDSNEHIAAGYFQVLCEVYATQPVRCPAHVVLGLVLVKLVDLSQEVREDAMHMLNVLHQREWPQHPGVQPGGEAQGPEGQAAAGGPSARGGAGAGGQDADGGDGGGGGGNGGGGGEEAVVVLGNLQDSYQEFQYTLACRLARDHPHLSETLCEEVMTRQLECEHGLIQHPVLTSLAPWMENLSIGFPWRGNWSERLLKSMYLVTLRHGSQFPGEIGRLWTQLARRTRNINPILDYLLHLGMETALQTDLGAMLEYLGVAKRIVLYLARVSPAETLGYLAIELAKQQMEEEPNAAAAAGAVGPGGQLAAGGGGSAAGGGRAAQGSQAPAQQQAAQVLVFGGPLDCLVVGVQMSCESGASVASMSAGGAGSTASGLGVGGDPSISSAATAAANYPNNYNRNNRSIDQGNRALSDASGSSRSDVNGLGGGGGGPGAGGGGAGVSVADSASTHPKGPGGGPDYYRLRPADDSAVAGPPSGVADSRLSPNLSRAHSMAGGAASVAGGRAMMTRPELVLCCLAEVVYEHPVDPQHLPLLLHVAVTCADHEEPLVAQHCRQLLINLLYSLSAAKLDESAAEDAANAGGGLHAGHPSSLAAGAGGVFTGAGAAASPTGLGSSASDLPAANALIRHLQSMRARRLWPCEEYCLAGAAAVAAAASADGHLLPSSSALAALTVALTEALSYEQDLAVEWAGRALEWAQHARSRHAACRSWQVLRALRPPLKADLAAALVLGLEACFQSGCAAGCEVAVEIIATTRVLVQSLPPGRLVLYPQLWWTALALLHSPHVAVYRAALGLLAACVGGPSPQLRLATAKVQAVLLAAAPGLSAGQLLAASHAAAMQDAAEDADPWVLGYHLLNVREGLPPSPHASIAVQQLLLRGLTHPLTVVPALQLLGSLGEALALQAHMLLLARTATPNPSPAATAGGARPLSGPLGGSHHPQQLGSGAGGLLGLVGSAASSSGGGAAAGGVSGGTRQPSSAIDGDVIEDAAYGTPAGGSGGGAGPGGRGASVVPHSDSLRKHRALKLDSFQTLLGTCRSQLFVSLMGLLPLMLSLYGAGGGSASNGDDFPPPLQGGGGGGGGGVPGRAVGRGGGGGGSAAAESRAGAMGAGGVAGGEGLDAGELGSAIAGAVAALGRAAACLGLTEVGAQLQVLSSPQVCHDPELLESVTTQLLTQISRALFPRYARCFLHHVTDLLVGGAASAPGPGGGGAGASAGSASSSGQFGSAAAALANAAAAGGVSGAPVGPRQVRAALVLLKCLFRVEGLRLGPAAAALVADGGVLPPVVALAAGPLGPLALETLAEAMRFSQEERFQKDLAEAAARGGAEQQQQQLLGSRTLFPPVTPVAVALKKVVDTLGSSLRRRNKNMKLLPFLGAGAFHD